MGLCHVSKGTSSCLLSGARSGQGHFGLHTVIVAAYERDTLYALSILCAMFKASRTETGLGVLEGCGCDMCTRVGGLTHKLLLCQEPQGIMAKI